MKMTQEQFEALRVAVTATAKRCARQRVNEGDYESNGWEILHRLLVDEPEPDPGVTTFGELDAGDWFVMADRSGKAMIKLWVKQRDGATALSAEMAVHLIIHDRCSVRRLPKPEFPR